MLEIIKEAGAILKDLPELAIWILLGILFYKVIIVGSVFGIIKYAIKTCNNMYSKSREPKEIIHKYDIDGKLITGSDVRDEFDKLMKKLQFDVGLSKSYIHLSNIKFAIEAIDEKKARENS